MQGSVDKVVMELAVLRFVADDECLGDCQLRRERAGPAVDANGNKTAQDERDRIVFLEHLLSIEQQKHRGMAGASLNDSRKRGPAQVDDGTDTRTRMVQLLLLSALGDRGTIAKSRCSKPPSVPLYSRHPVHRTGAGCRLRSADVELVVVRAPEDPRLRGDLEGLGFQPMPFGVDDLRDLGIAGLTEIITDAHARSYGYNDSKKSRGALLRMLMTSRLLGLPESGDCRVFTKVDLLFLTRDRFRRLTHGWGVPTFCMPVGRRRTTSETAPLDNSVAAFRCEACQAAKAQAVADGGSNYGVRCNAHAAR